VDYPTSRPRAARKLTTLISITHKTPNRTPAAVPSRSIAAALSLLVRVPRSAVHPPLPSKARSAEIPPDVYWIAGSPSPG